MSSDEHSTKTTTTDYFLDTYAIVEIARKNPNYERYIGVPFAMTKLNLFELHQYLLRGKGEAYADELIRWYLPNVVDYEVEVIKKASKLRAGHPGKNLSMTDCVGYVYARENDMVFVTGDMELMGMENVEFVK